mgnify:CR=1 FL=1
MRWLSGQFSQPEMPDIMISITIMDFTKNTLKPCQDVFPLNHAEQLQIRLIIKIYNYAVFSHKYS